MVLLAIFKFIVSVWSVLTLPFYYLIYQPWTKVEAFRRQRAQIVKVEEDAVTFRDLPQRSKISQMFSDMKISTMEEVWSLALGLFSGRKCLGTRAILEEQELLAPNGKMVKKLLMEPMYKWKTYDEVDQQSTYIGR